MTSVFTRVSNGQTERNAFYFDLEGEKLPPAVQVCDTTQSEEHGIDSPFYVTISTPTHGDTGIVMQPAIHKLFGGEWIIYDDGYQPLLVMAPSEFEVTYFEME
ncbi:MAG: hypothetical protein ACR2PR_08915 [Pseudohongiellaceae bacterium]